MADASAKVFATTEINHVSSGSSIAAGSLSASTPITDIVGTGNAARYPRADVVLKYLPGSTTATTALNIYLYRRDLNVGSSDGDDPVPSTLKPGKFMGAFQVSASTSTGTDYMTITDVPLPTPGDCQFYISNALTNTIPAGWTLTVTPKTDVGSTT